MDFSLTEEQVLLRDSVEKYVAENCSVERHRALAATEAGFDPQAWSQFAELGWLAVPFAETHGGFDGGAVDVMVICEALGKALVREPYLHTVITCGGFLQRGGSNAQQAQYIPWIIDGSAQWAFAFAERGSDFDLANVATRATSSGAGYTLDGRKIAVLNGHCADYLIVSARLEDAVGLFIVDSGAAGVEREAFVAVDGSRGAHISFDGVEVDADARLGEPGDGLQLVREVVDHAIVAMAGETLGHIHQLLVATLEYTRTS
ncbi:MAG: acyl-CoA dehydrogenase family protein [Halioglobus sp.]|nr:acyl-CoA dehydrogenase family protein [Halioglobus sp.]